MNAYGGIAVGLMPVALLVVVMVALMFFVTRKGRH